MRAKRAVIMATLVGCLALTAFMVALALPSGQEAAFEAQPHGGNALPSAPQLGQGAGTASEQDPDEGGTPAFFIWIGAVVGASGVTVSFLVFRVEVRKEKDMLRAKKQRAQYYKDLKRYNAQLK